MHFLYNISLSKQQSIIPPLHYKPFPHLPYYTLFAPQRFCITFVIHLPWLLQSSQEKLKPWLCNFFCGGGDKGGKQGALWELCKWQYKCYNKICKLGFHISVFIGGKCSITFLKAKQASFGGRF